MVFITHAFSIYVTADASHKICSSTFIPFSLWKRNHLFKVGLVIFTESCFYLLNYTNRWWSLCSSQSILFFHKSWIIFFGFSIVSAKIPNGSSIVEIMLKIPFFVSGKFLATGLNHSLSVLAVRMEPTVLSPLSDPRSKLTNFDDILNDGNNFKDFVVFDTKLVKRYTCIFKTVVILWLQ